MIQPLTQSQPYSRKSVFLNRYLLLRSKDFWNRNLNLCHTLTRKLNFLQKRKMNLLWHKNCLDPHLFNSQSLYQQVNFFNHRVSILQPKAFLFPQLIYSQPSYHKADFLVLRLRDYLDPHQINSQPPHQQADCLVLRLKDFLNPHPINRQPPHQ
jgi:hypothetical protein